MAKIKIEDLKETESLNEADIKRVTGGGIVIQEYSTSAFNKTSYGDGSVRFISDNINIYPY